MQVMHRVSGVQGADLQLLPQEGNESRCVLAHAYFLQGQDMHWDLLDGCHWGTELQLLIRTKQGKGHTHTLFSPASLFRFSCCNSHSHKEGGTSPWVAHTLHYRARSLWSQRTVKGTYWRQGNRLEMKVGRGRTQSLGLGNSR